MLSAPIALVEARPRPLAAVRVTTLLARWPREFKTSLDKVYEAVRAGGVKQRGHNVMVYHPRQDGLVDIECGVDVAAKFAEIGEVVNCETPGGPAVTVTHAGPYDQLGVSHRAIVDWCRLKGHRLTGVCWEIYGDWDEDPANLRTDLFHQLASK